MSSKVIGTTAGLLTSVALTLAIGAGAVTAAGLSVPGSDEGPNLVPALLLTHGEGLHAVATDATGDEGPNVGTTGDEGPNLGTLGDEGPNLGTTGDEGPNLGTLGDEGPNVSTLGTTGDEGPNLVVV
ncbi:hypothetical protein C1708_05605 [Streptomyces sp. DH-12]|uniref:hypothetical protein n=1 Tax=Streptomyces sp. DH-12 TaxID=2072509 RepID=UPI000CCF6522|nr:hypothetical protein [Streptomyces sp. DH-12]PNV31852.1 hypothetical protein C1708_05605 [Streptomyces sp. DH-12]